MCSEVCDEPDKFVVSRISKLGHGPHKPLAGQIEIKDLYTCPASQGPLAGLSLCSLTGGRALLNNWLAK